MAAMSTAVEADVTSLRGTTGSIAYVPGVSGLDVVRARSNSHERHQMLRKTLLSAIVGLLVFGAVACGGDSDSSVDDGGTSQTTVTTEATETEDGLGGGGGNPAAGACPEDDPDCYEDGTEATPGPSSDESGEVDSADDEILRQEAQALLGQSQADLPADVRIARIGDESFMLTEDYVIGRKTVELDDTDGSGLRVVSVTVELDGGPKTFDLTAG